jgi:hypothetical protein
MRGKTIFTVTIFAVLGIFMAACNLRTPTPTGNVDQSAQQTIVMQTVQAVLTQQAFETLVAQASHVAEATPTATQVPPEPTATQIPPTATVPLPTATATQKPVPCNWAQYIKDVNVPDGTDFASGQKFTKTWQLKNIGTCTWTKDYDLVFVDGNAMNGPSSVALKGDVRPGETVDISVELAAPSKQGDYKGFWMLRDASDRRFGYGDNADKQVWVDIDVTGYMSDDVPSAIYGFDFAAAICQAEWFSGDGNVALPCAGKSQSESQWASVLMTPTLEGGRQENERAIWMHLPDSDDWMQGFYPATQIDNGEKFIAWIGCLDMNKKCNATFSLDIRVDGGQVQNLNKWNETFDEKWTQISIDLSQFAGKNVQFILGVTNKNSSDPLDIFWMVPSVQ